jgi:hypothetical protein
MGGLYGSPELGPYAEPRQQIKTIKKEGYKPQENIWVWIVVAIVNILLLSVSVTLENVVALLALDSMVLFGISVVSLVVNLIKKRRIGNDIKFIGISILTFLIFTILLSTL